MYYPNIMFYQQQQFKTTETGVFSQDLRNVDIT